MYMSWRSLACDDEMRAAVLRERAFVVTGIEGEFLAIADRAEAIRRDADEYEVAARADRAPFAERQIVFGGSAFVAMSLYGNRPRWVFPERRRVFVERRLAGRRQLAAVEIVEHRLQRRTPV